MRIISMNKTANLLYVCVMILRCISHFHNVYAKQQIPLSLNYKGKYTSDIKNFEIVFPQRVTKDGNFISHLVQHHHSKRSTNEMQYIFYKIPIGGKDYLIELTPNKELISPGAVVEIRKEGVRKSSKREFLNENNPNETLRQMFENLEIKKLKNTECHFSGHVKGENTSKAALSTCYGLAGFIQIEQGFYTIEPVAGRDPFVENSYPHILYQEDGLENSSNCHTIREMAKALVDKVVRKRRESSFGSSVPMFAETLIVMDKTMVNHHRDLDCENYVLTVFNMAFNLFRDVSLGMLMTLTIVRIIRLETEDDQFKFQMNLKLDENAEKTLKYFQTWQYEINPGDDTHPNHHDIALLLTRVNVCYSPTSCGILGLTTIGKACDPKQSAALCEDSGLRLGYVIAHEIGHLLGADHDTANSTCKGTSKNGLRTVMHPHVSLTSKTWSKCSQAYFRKFFKTVENCFLDEPEEHQFNGQDLLPGVMYNANFQCKYLFASNSRECEIGSTCTSLNCHIPGYACIVTHTPPADGTRCGESMWCHNSKCLMVGERPGAVDGNWGEWSAWSDCTRTCGSGVASSMRNCDKPQPAHGGKNCAGERKRYKICAATITIVPQNISDLIRLISEEVNVSFVGKPCETGRPSFRDIQCGEFNDWIYPEDGKIHSWKAHYFHEDNPCVLYCINEDREVAALRPRVVDGTMCYRGFRDLCIAGSCKSLPCDLQFGSNAVEDACGVCHGDGTGCEFSQGVQTLPKLKRGLTKLVNIPVGTKNINVEEMSPTSAKIVVRDKDTKDIYVRGLGIFNVPGSQAWLGMIKKDQEALRIPGPVSKPLSIWIHRLENVTVKWSMALPAEQQRKPAFVWDFLKWGPCSAECGPGTQKSEPSCVEEKAGLVEDSFCADLQMPAAKVRPCEIAKCIPRWMVGDWKSCYMSRSQEKEKKRAVYCIKKVGEGEGETEIVPDSQCKDPKPHSVEPCENRKKREDSDYNYLTEEAIYSTDTSDKFAFHKKYDDDCSKHFVVIPQKKSEIRPFHLMPFPHFRHFIHILESPEDSETDSMENHDLNKYLIDNIRGRLQNKVSPDFYKNMFSRHQTDISHLINKEGVLIDNSKEAKKITKQKVADKIIFIRPAKKGPSRQKRDKTRNISRRSNLYYQSSHCQTRFFAPKKNLLLPDSKAFENTQSNGSWKTYFITSQTENDLYPEVKTARKKTIQRKGRESVKKTNWKYNFYLPHMGRQKLMKREFFFKVFNRSSPRMKSKNGKTLKKLNFLKPSLKRKFNQAEDRTPGLLGKKIKKCEKNRDKNLFLNSINDNFFRSTDYRGRLRSKDSFFGEKNSKIYYKRNSNPIFTCRKLNKTKRSNWKKKKLKPKETNPKSIKNSNEYSCNTETRNYLNNLFRENRKKATTQKPPETVTYPVEEPVIQAGKIVIDRDSIEDKQVEILFLDEDTDERSEKCGQLPRPPVNEKRLSLRGQEVFDLIQKLQRRSCLYRQHNETEEKPKTELQVRIPEDAPDKNEDVTSEAMKESDTPKTTSTSQEETETTETTTKKEKLTGVTESTQSRVLTTTKVEFTSKNESVEEITIEKSDKEDQYDIDEILPYPPNGSVEEATTEQTKRKRKKEKMKDKEKGKKKKGPYLEDYQQELDEGEKSKTNTTPTSGYYNWRNLFKRKKRHRTWRQYILSQ